MQANARHRALGLAVVLVACSQVGCSGKGGSRVPDASNQVMQSASFVGVLRGGIMGVGGESTGWRLESGEREQFLELDVSRLRNTAETLSGMKVRAVGRMTTVEYVERGATQVLVVESLTKVR